MDSLSPNHCDLAVIGLGRIGLPISISAAHSGFRVLGVESNKNTVKMLERGFVPFRESGLKEKLVVTNGINFKPCFSENLQSQDFTGIRYIMIAVGVHNITRRYPEPFEYKAIERVINYLIDRDCLRGRLLVLRPTQPIGSTRRIKELIESKWNLVEGKDYYIAYMPERILEGEALEEESRLPRIIGTFNDQSFAIANEMLEKLGGIIQRVSSPEVAEFVKLLDNSWRHTKFAFSNDAALAAENVGIDVNEAISAANFEYPRNSIAYPGPVSGYCLGKDPYIFEYAFRDTEISRKFNSIWYYSILSSKYLLEHIIGKVSGTDILIMGLSFKKDIDDYRLSHGVTLTKRLVEAGCSVTVVDKDYKTNDYTQLDQLLLDKIKIENSLENIDNEICFDSVIVCVNNAEFAGKEKLLMKHGKIIDLWSMYKDKKSYFKKYWSLGGPES